MLRPAILLLSICLSAFAQADFPEDFRLEVTGAGWHTGVQGTLQSGIFPVDLRTDLAIRQRWTFYGTLVWKPAPRHRLFIEGAPFQYEGWNPLSRTIDYRGQSFTIHDVVSSEATLTYVYAGYQYDVVHHETGHFGFNFGGAYLDAEGTIRSGSTGISATRRQQFGVPLAGAEFRLLPVARFPRFRGVTVTGGAKGAPLGGFGYFTQGTVSGGYSVGPLTVLAGWAVLDADIHENRDVSPAGVAPRISGPVFSIQYRVH